LHFTASPSLSFNACVQIAGEPHRQSENPCRHKFNALGQITGYTYGNGVVTTNQYFANSKRLQRMTASVRGTNHQDLSYTFDTVSNIKTIGDGVFTSTNSAALTNVVYDDLYRVISVGAVARAPATFAYDSIGNVLTNGDFGAGGYAYGAKPHAVTNANGTSYSYDACGNMVTRGAQTLTYDEQNQLSAVGGTTFGYSDSGARLWRYGSGGYTVWIGGIYEYSEPSGKALCHVMAGGQRIATFEPQGGGLWTKVVGEQRWAAAYPVIDRFLSWPFQNGRGTYSLLAALFAAIGAMCLVSRRRQPSPRFVLRRSGLWWKQAVSFLFIAAFITAETPKVDAQTYNPVFYYYHPNHLGSANILTDRNGSRVQHYEYGSFGQTTYTESSAAYPISNRYTGQVIDDETGLYYYNARYYDPQLGRFIQADTIVPSATSPQTLNRYSYCSNNPLNAVDPTGHIGWIAAVIIGAAVGAAMSAATGGNILLGAACGAIGGALGCIGSAAGSALGAAIGGTTGAAVGSAAGTLAGGAAGGAATSAISGGDPGMGALTGAISAGITFGVGYLNTEVLGGALSEFAVSEISATVGGGIGSELQGGDFAQGAAYGAAGAAIGYGVYSLTNPEWRSPVAAVRGSSLAAGDALEVSRAEDLDSDINDNKFGHAENMSFLQRGFGPLATPFLAVGGLGYEAWHIFFPGHTQDRYVDFYQSLHPKRPSPYFGLFDGQNPLNWLYDTPGDLLGNAIGQASGLFLSPRAATYFNRAGFLIPGPNYAGKPESAATKLTLPGATWPW
jgi:RHS repeat-associated protein